MKIAIYGGSFNPVHNEHINIVRAAKNSLGLDRIIVIPTFISPHKKGVLCARARDRLQMCRLAFNDIEGVEVSDYEIKRGGVSYSYVTCRHFKKLYPSDELYFIIGADMLESFHLWREPEEVLKCVTLAVCARENGETLKTHIKAFNSRFKKEIVQIDYVGAAVSSTKIRARAALEEDISKYVPNSVKRHIVGGELYYLPQIAGVKKLLSEDRWQHTVRVAEMALSRCSSLGIYEEDALIAAALHDCAKYLGKDADELKGFDPPENVPTPVLHQFSGAYVAEYTFGIKDTNILNAIRYHTSGRENMSAIEKLIFLSDMLEEGRDFESVEELRKLFYKDINICLLTALKHQLNYLESTGKSVYSLTRRAYEYMKENYDE